MRAISARFAEADRVPGLIDASSWPISSAESTELFPFLTLCFGPRTACAGFVGMTWPVTSRSNGMRMAARCCLTLGLREHRAELLFQTKFFLLAPFGKLRDGDEVRAAGVPVPDVGREEFPKALARGFRAEKNRVQLVGRGRADEGELAPEAGKLWSGGVMK
jgi:hypothetical protein